jgi:hypothetical protein
VSGRVYDASDNVSKGKTFDVLNQADKPVSTFTTDASGTFTVYLDPGTYKVRPKGDDTVEGTIASAPQPVRQDVRLHRR